MPSLCKASFLPETTPTNTLSPEGLLRKQADGPQGRMISNEKQQASPQEGILAYYAEHKESVAPS